MYVRIGYNIISLNNIQSIRGSKSLNQIEIKYLSGGKDIYEFYSEEGFEDAYQFLLDGIKKINAKQEG